MYYGDKRESKVNIARVLVEKGWKIYGYKNDESNMMVDYYSPADWGGIAEKDGFILCIDQSSLSYSGYEQKEYIGGNAEYKTNARIQKLEAMMNDEASTDNEKASCAVLIEKEKEKAGMIEKYKVVETYPTFSHPNPKSCSWHIEKDGQIIAKGTGVFACYQNNDHIETNRIERDTKINKLIARFEKAIKDTGALKGEVVKVEKKVIKPVEKEDKTINVDDVLSFSYHGHYWVVTEVYKNKNNYTCIVYELLGSAKRGYQRLKWTNTTRYYETLDRLNKGMEEGKVKVHTLQEVIEYQEKTVFKKTSRKQNVSNVPAIETTEETQETVSDNTEENEVEEPATTRQLWALHCATKLDTRGMKISKTKASELITKSKAGHNIILEVKAHMNTNETIAPDKENGLIGKSGEVTETNNYNESQIYESIDIEDLDQYTVSDELQARLHSSSMFQVDYKKDCYNTFLEIQEIAKKTIDEVNDTSIQYQIKKYLQSFKKRYYEKYIEILNHRANNPSWAVTGRGGLNVRRYNKMQDRYGNMLGEFSKMRQGFENKMNRFRDSVRQVEQDKIKKAVNNVTTTLEFKVEQKEINVAGYKEKVRTYNYKNYMIAKSWGMFRVFKDGKEVETTLKTTSRLDEAKQFVNYLVGKEEQVTDEAINNSDNKRRILQEESGSKNSNQQQYISKINKQIESAQRKVNALSGDYLTNTWKRQQEAASREQKKDNLNLEISILEHLKEKATNNIMNEFDIALLVGSFREDMRVKYKSRGKHNYEVKYPTINPDIDVNGWWNLEVPKLQKRLNKAGIHNTEQYNEAIDKYAALVKAIERPVNPIQQKIKKMESEAKLRKIDGYFPTPKTIVQRMIELADIQDSETYLAP
ncbi:UNVERIFIED_CONTAM: hypothetical protein ABIC26_002891 [Paenibacillus sp. PvR008]